MKKFTISSRMQKYEFQLIEEKINHKLPTLLFEFLSTYGGMFIKERFFRDFTGKIWKMEEIKLFHFIYNYIDEIEEELNLANIDKTMIPFANEETGWFFCISTEKKYPVYIFKTNGYSGIDAFLQISDSFEEFINELQEFSNEEL